MEMVEKDEPKFRLSAFVSKETYNAILEMQLNEKVETGRKPSQGEIIDKWFNQKIR